MAVVAALGASTPVGRCAWSTAAAVRAGISRVREHPYRIDSAGEPLRVASASWLDPELGGVERFAALLLPAIEQALAPLLQTAPALRCALMLGLPSPRPGLSETLRDELVDRITRSHGELLVSVSAYPAGHAAGLVALQAAIERLGQGDLDGCVVAGVDSYLAAETLSWLEAGDRLHGAGPLNNAWGFIPGEAAGAVLVMRERTAERLGRRPLAVILGTGAAHEPKGIKTRSVCIGEGLTQAFRGALRALPAGTQVSDVYCDLNGEPYRADEYGFAALRTKEAFRSVTDFVAPADCWGDVGAAGGPLHLILAAIAGAKGYARGDTAFIWASAEEGERAAALLTAGSGGRTWR